MRTAKIIGVVAILALTASAAALAYAPTDTGTLRHSTVSSKDIAAVRHLRQLADGHSDACKANYDQCMKACDGMTSCSNQCTTNYNGCMQNGQ